MPRGARGGYRMPLLAKIGKCNSKEEVKRVVRKHIIKCKQKMKGKITWE